jgi:hypothetical protein
MSTIRRNAPDTPNPTTTRRAFLKSIAAGAAASALLATGRNASAGRPLPNFEPGSAPVIGLLSSFKGAPSAPRRLERRTPV